MEEEDDAVEEEEDDGENVVFHMTAAHSAISLFSASSALLGL